MNYNAVIISDQKNNNAIVMCLRLDKSFLAKKNIDRTRLCQTFNLIMVKVR